MIWATWSMNLSSPTLMTWWVLLRITTSCFLKYYLRCSRDYVIINLPKPWNTSLCTENARWLGKTADGIGVLFDEEYISGLTTLQRAVTAGDLQRFVCGAGWLRPAVPHFAEIISELQAWLRSQGTSHQKQLNRIRLHWDEQLTNAWEQLREAIQHTVKLGYFSLAESIATCLFTDASDRFWSIVLTQCPQIELQLPVLDQRHTPLACMSGAFQRIWVALAYNAQRSLSNHSCFG